MTVSIALSSHRQLGNGVIFFPILAVHVGFSIVGMALYLAAFMHGCGGCPPSQVTAGILIALQVAGSAMFWGIAALLVLRRPKDRFVLVLASTLVMIGTLSPSMRETIAVAHPTMAGFADLSASLGWATFFVTMCYLFPNGRWTPRWSPPLAVGWYVLNAPSVIEDFYPDSPLNYSHWPAPVALVLVVGLFGSGIGAQLYRYRSVSAPVERRQTKWVVFALMVSGLGFLALIVPGMFVRGIPTYPAVLYTPVGAVVNGLLFLPIPLGLAVAILRHRLWDIDLVINRALVYGSVTLSVVGLYVLIVGGLGALFQTHGSLVLSLLATGFAAVLFQPLRQRLQWGVNRLMYGERDEPYAVLSRLGRRLDGTLTPEAALFTIVETVAQALKLPYVAIMIASGTNQVIAAEAGILKDEEISLPLLYQSETVGRLILAPRSGERDFAPADRRLLDDLARQAGIAVHAIRLTADLQRSRERLVTAREEERRRLRRDLHDGLGPTLASLFQRLDVAGVLIPRDPDAAVAVVNDMKDQVKTTIADIRRLVYALRPPALDEYGLVSALRVHAARYDRVDGLSLELDAPDAMPALPAAVEVAAYYIATEALNNVVRHAQAHMCHISLRIDGALLVEVSDDGMGLSAGCRSGVGMTSMRERAEELGGDCRIEGKTPRGTRVVARLPLTRE